MRNALLIIILFPIYVCSNEQDVIDFISKRIEVYERLLQELDCIEKNEPLLYYYVGRIEAYEDVIYNTKRSTN